jgi:FixJ family two-component response regulator
MPGGTGLEMMRSLQEAQIQPPAIYMSGYSGASLTRQGNLEKESPFLQKPFTNQDLLIKIREVLDLASSPLTCP